MTHPLYQVKEFSIVLPFTLDISFNDGLIRRIFFLPFLRGEIYGPLKDIQLFERVALDTEAHTLVWPNGADFDPATLHDWPSQTEDVKAAVEHWSVD